MRGLGLVRQARKCPSCWPWPRKPRDSLCCRYPNRWLSRYSHDYALCQNRASPVFCFSWSSRGPVPMALIACCSAIGSQRLRPCRGGWAWRCPRVGHPSLAAVDRRRVRLEGQTAVTIGDSPGPRRRCVVNTLLIAFYSGCTYVFLPPLTLGRARASIQVGREGGPVRNRVPKVSYLGQQQYGRVEQH